MGCKFCASTLGGLDRNLTPSEMLSQIYYIQRDIIKGTTQFTEMLEATILDAFKRLIEPSIEREIRSDLTEKEYPMLS